MTEIVAENISIIRSDELEMATRIDAEHYQKEYITLRDKIESIGSVPLLNLISSNVVTGHTPSMRQQKYYGGNVNFIKTDNLRTNQISDDFNHKLTEIGNRQILRSFLKEKDIIVTIIGATYDIIGRACLIAKEILPANINQNIALIRVNEKVIPEYLNVYINSKFGRKYLHYLSRQTEQVNLSCREVEQLLVPLFPIDFQKQIKDFLINAYKFLHESKILYSQAEPLLLEELGIKDIDLSHEPCYEVNSADTITANRFDAEYYQPKYERVIEAIKNCKFGWCNLDDKITNLTDKYDSTKEPEKDFRYIELSNINPSIGVIDGYSELKGKDLPSRARMLIKEGDVIISSVEGSIEKIALVDNHHDGCLASTGFFVFRAKENTLPEYALTLCKSALIQKQLEKLSSGTILTAVPKNLVQSIIIPNTPKEAQTEIANLIRQSHSARRQAKELLEEAKRKVEEMIEKGGNT